jgi:ferric-dicitrate binding protein FerR (iron transport regulator)
MQATGWMQGKFAFTETPLAEVVAEIERRYDIRVIPDYNPDYLYTGNFSKTERPEEVLEIIGKPFGITFNIAGR